MNLDKWISKMEADQKVPGFTTSVKTRPLVISKLEAYIRDRQFVFHSKRLLEELRVFIWQHGKAQAQTGYNDDLVISLGIGLFARDTGVKLHQQSMDLTRASLGGISSTKGGPGDMPLLPNGVPNPYRIETSYGHEDITWLL
jgi:hypothetical protein